MTIPLSLDSIYKLQVTSYKLSIICMKTTVVSVKLPSDLVKELRELCQQTGLSQVSVFRHALIRYLPVVRAIEGVKENA